MLCTTSLFSATVLMFFLKLSPGLSHAVVVVVGGLRTASKSLPASKHALDCSCSRNCSLPSLQWCNKHAGFLPLNTFQQVSAAGGGQAIRKFIFHT